MSDLEAIPYDVLLAQMEAALHRAQSENVMLHARITVRDRQIGELRDQLASAGAARPDQPVQAYEHQPVQLPPPADQEPVPHV